MVQRLYFHVAFVLCLLWLQAGAQSRPAVTLQDLRCESKVHPLGIAAAQPVFSWQLQSADKHVMQTHYRVRVASAPQLLNGRPDLWDSGKIPAARSTFVPYQGRPLQSAATCYWKVEVWTSKGGPAATGTAAFTTGILHPEEWAAAKWIGYAAMPDSMRIYPGVHGSGNKLGSKGRQRTVVPYLRRSFRVQKPVQQALVFVCGLGQYELYLNGQQVGNDFLAPGWTNYNKTCLYNTYDVTQQLQQDNAIGAIVGNGFFNINRERYRKLVIAQGYPMLRLKLVIRYTDGSAEEIVTDKNWKAAPSPVVFTSIYGGEDYDATLEQDGWCRPGFDDARWQPAVTVKGPGGAMQAQMAYPLRVMDTFAVKSAATPQPGRYVADFGQNASGIIRIKVKGRKGSVVRITPAELVDDEGLPYQKASGSPYYFSYTLKGEGVEEWTPRFTYYGLRYAMVEGAAPAGTATAADSVQLQDITFLHTRNSAPTVGHFQCSDTLFNRIFRLIDWAIRSNLASVSTDCPHREKLGWLEQTYLLRACVGYNYDILHLYNKTVNDMMAAQLPNGLVPDIAPEYVVFEDGFRDSPEWGSAAIQIPWFLYTWYGDRQVLERAYPMMQRYLQYLGSRAHGHILDYGLGDWYDMGPERPGFAQLTPVSLTATAIYFQDADVLAGIARVLGREAEARRYRLLADSIRHAFNNKFFNAATGVYATGSQTAMAMPVYTGLVEPRYREKVIRNLADSIRSNNYALTAGDIGYHYLVNVLSNYGQSQLLYDMNNRDNVPGYAFQLKHGATALTESWPALRLVSNNHMMLGHLMEWFYNGLAGIRQAAGSTGFSMLEIAPQPVDGINWVKAGFTTLHGHVQVEWKREGHRFSLDVTVPPNTRARILLPGNKKATVAGSGNHHFTAALP
ncbi:family 78 glycoside hydrolase catalytic domain [Chitinophaga japonensis]|uniref:alpha-L-rhamnosidase n=1 Tax=Chitinophaga japonensis TaxID=104662 RepID=A0A562SI87_CHIJA|nr:family 78 glycoside hydrolase catalytic domain [Chitinophaga japonensis]TWI80995.1 alpha-L-rhamnosidase-like protein [Chitinophaga japonensis]